MKIKIVEYDFDKKINKRAKRRKKLQKESSKLIIPGCVLVLYALEKRDRKKKKIIRKNF